MITKSQTFAPFILWVYLDQTFENTLLFCNRVRIIVLRGHPKSFTSNRCDFL